MRTIVLLSYLLCVYVIAAPPESLTTLDGRTYTGITSAKSAGNVVRIIHRDGAVTIPFGQIPEGFRSSLGYDPVASAAQDAKDAADVRAIAEQQSRAAAAAAKSTAREQVIKASKQKAIATLKSRKFGGSIYWSSNREGRLNQRGSAVNFLSDAGFTYAEAEKIIQSMIDSGKSDPRPSPPPHPPLNPEFLRPQGVLRNIPATP